MLKSYLVIVWRNLLRHKLYSIINVSGLAIGISCCLLILLYVQDELSYDRFHDQCDQVYRIIHEREDQSGKRHRMAMTPSAFAPHMMREFPEINNAVRILFKGGSLKYENRYLDSSWFVYTDQTFFDVFSFPLVKGDPRTALQEPFSLVLTESAARQAFGDEDPLDKTITYRDEFEFKVTGVVQDPPPTSHFEFNYLASSVSLEGVLEQDDALENYGNWTFYTYLLLSEGYPPAQLEEKYPDFTKKYRGIETHSRIFLQPLADIHLTPDLEFDTGPRGDIRYVYTFVTVAFFILLIACINFMNLATARSTPRAREVGLRKTVGALRYQLVGQFMGESIILSLMALGLGVTLVELLLPWFNELANKQLVLNYASSPGIVLGLLIIGLSVGVISGSYPAFYLSSFQPVSVLRGAYQPGTKSAKFRTVLIVVQFAISIVLLICTAAVWKQFDYMKSQRLGFDKEHVVVMWMNNAIKQHYGLFKQEVLQNPHILKMSAVYNLPGSVRTRQGFSWEGSGEKERAFYMMAGDPDGLEVLGLELVEGRNLSWSIPTDKTQAYILNETAVRELGWEKPLGREFRVGGRNEPGRVIGVVKDFHFKSLHQKIEPLVFYMRPDWHNRIIVKISSEDIPGILGIMKEKWEALSPEHPFHYTFLDEDFDRLYKAEERLSLIFGSFSLLAIFVACLGLLGLVSFTIEQRTREIGIRKVLGASISSIAVLLSKEFMWLVFLANLIAWPIAFFSMNRWLQDFAYRIDLGPGIFVLGGALALLITLLTVSSQALKAALSNPVDALRYE